MAGFKGRFMTKNQQILYALGQAARDSIVDGSAVTGSPGQPVDSSERTIGPPEGELINSWRLEFPTPNEAKVTTDLGPKAWSIEHGHRAPTKAVIKKAKKLGFFAGTSVRRVQRIASLKIPFTVRSARGGFHSIKLTRANFSRLVELVATRFRS